MKILPCSPQRIISYFQPLHQKSQIPSRSYIINCSQYIPVPLTKTYIPIHAWEITPQIFCLSFSLNGKIYNLSYLMILLIDPFLDINGLRIVKITTLHLHIYLIVLLPDDMDKLLWGFLQFVRAIICLELIGYT